MKMRISWSKIVTQASAVLLVASLGAVARAGLDYRPSDGRWIRVEYQHAALQGVDLGVEDANWILDGHLTLDNGVGLRMEVPVTHFSQDYRDAYSGGYVTSGATALGNVYFGLETPRGISGDSWEFGVRLPTAPDKGDAAAVAVVATVGDWVGGFERFFPNTFSAVGMGHIAQQYFTDTLGLHVDLGMSAANYASEDWKASVLWGAGLDLVSPAGPEIGAGLQARSLLGQGSDTVNVDLVVHAAFAGGAVEPTVQFRRPLDSDRSDFVDAVLSVALKAYLP
jgi:hypothetical protein